MSAVRDRSIDDDTELGLSEAIVLSSPATATGVCAPAETGDTEDPGCDDGLRGRAAARMPAHRYACSTACISTTRASSACTRASAASSATPSSSLAPAAGASSGGVPDASAPPPRAHAHPPARSGPTRP